MSAREGLGSAFAAAVGEWPAASKRVVRVSPAANGGWRASLTEPVPAVLPDVLDIPVPLMSTQPDAEVFA
ncbi:hypothetical protein ACFFQW_22805 [Umezawaea endophytica]|uniref:Uncharacterized protein n=1 Tax=Umezawaea endophytica TaxID=1654476 RepID=A0A9X2VIP0_9PSEU|nr:hypothetical protein [Umezawaea endophytica]MCS7477266.1 hypothetical protein [Umezawaea endophytica]